MGGGSCCDYAKAVSVSVNEKDDAWQKYFIRFEEPTCKIIPVGCILTMAGTGSEMNGGSVSSNHKEKLKIGHVFGDEVMPKFSILNPKFTYSLPKRQMVAGIYDIFNHICEQYFSGTDDNTSDYIAEALMKSVIKSSLVGAQYAYCVRKDYGLDGAYARSSRRRVYGRYPRYDFIRRVACVL